MKTLVLSALILLCISSLSPFLGISRTFTQFASAIKVENLDLALGSEKGITERSAISTEVLQKILQGVENGNRDNIYFYGLLKMYGISVSKDLHGAR